MLFINHFLCLILFLSSFDFNPKKDVSVLKNSIINSFKKHESEKYLGYKSYKFEITDEGFIRYRRVLANNKSEYYSVKIDKFLEVKYHGTEKSGWLFLNCEPSSVIFQTYRDPAGNVDSMTNEIVFPLNSISVDDLNLLKDNFQSLKTDFSNTQY